MFILTSSDRSHLNSYHYELNIDTGKTIIQNSFINLHSSF